MTPSFSSRTRRRALAAGAALAAAGLVLTGCAGGGAAGGGSDAEPITIGTTDKITTIDPAGAYDNGSFAVMKQVYAFLMSPKPGSPDVVPDLAESAEFTSPTVFTVKLKPGLTFSNGHALTSSDVKFTFDRMLKINDENGPASLLYNLASVVAVDDTTVEFHLKQGDDQLFGQILSSPAGPIVDEEVFSPDALTPDADIVAGDAFAGPYKIDSYEMNSLVSYVANPAYNGILGAPKTESIVTKYYTDSSNLKLDVQEGNIDVAWRSLSATDVGDLRGNSKVTVHEGPGGEIRYLVFNFDTMPFGATTPEADPAKALAVRQAIASLIDRQEIADQVYQGTYTPLYSAVPSGLTGSAEPMRSLYGDGQGGPSVDKAKSILAAAGITGPVTLSIQYSNDHYGPSSADEYALIKDQLEASGLFTVNLQTTEWTQYSKDRTNDVYPVYQLGWFPDYSDADNYLTPFFLTENFLHNHYANQQVNDLILQQAVTPDAAQRTQLIEQIQQLAAQDLSTIPYLQGAQIAVAGTDIEGVDDTLDASFTFRYALLERTK